MGDGLNRAALMESVLRLLGCFWRLGRAASDLGMGGAGCARRRGMVRGGFAQRLATWGLARPCTFFPGTSWQKTLEAKNLEAKNLEGKKDLREPAWACLSLLEPGRGAPWISSKPMAKKV